MLSKKFLLDTARVLRGASMVLTEMAKLQPGAVAGTLAIDTTTATSTSPTKTAISPTKPSSNPPTIKPMTITNGADLRSMATTIETEPLPSHTSIHPTITTTIPLDTSASNQLDTDGNKTTIPPTTTKSTHNSTPSTPPALPTPPTPFKTPPSSTTSTRSTAPSNVLNPEAVPATQISRVLGFGTLATRLAFGTVGEIVRRQFDQIAEDNTKRAILSDGNMDVLASTLCRMRGAALKLGQMLSMADNKLVPKELSEALDRVRQHADRMPEPQLNETMTNELGTSEWRNKFIDFQDMPLAAASLGQVHRATHKESGDEIVVKGKVFFCIYFIYVVMISNYDFCYICFFVMVLF